MTRLMRNAIQVFGGIAIFAFLIALVAITEDERRALQAAHRQQECEEWTQIARDLGERLQTVDAGIELWKLKCIAKGLK
jgi:hypothetical protein